MFGNQEIYSQKRKKVTQKPVLNALQFFNRMRLCKIIIPQSYVYFMKSVLRHATIPLFVKKNSRKLFMFFAGR